MDRSHQQTLPRERWVVIAQQSMEVSYDWLIDHPQAEEYRTRLLKAYRSGEDANRAGLRERDILREAKADLYDELVAQLHRANVDLPSSIVLLVTK